MKSIMTGLMFTTALWGTATASYAGDWVILTGTQTSVMAVDRESVRRRGASATFWVAYVPGRPEQAGATTYDYQIQQWEGDCDRSTVRFTMIYFHGLEGDVRDIRESDLPALPAPPDSNFGRVLTRVCNEDWGEGSPFASVIEIARLARTIVDAHD
jgi:hypothetical protein